ncbi:hypothetical protein DOE76_07730 [Leifsonia sp. ku-ls]|nr:hypothetical protein DOE76_07730 [Leifsonia sp. ku-ls]
MGAAKLLMSFTQGAPGVPKLTGLYSGIIPTIRDIASGATTPGSRCDVDVRSLQLVAIVAKKYGSVQLNDLNRNCAGDPEATCDGRTIPVSPVHCVEKLSPPQGIDFGTIGGLGSPSAGYSQALLGFLSQIVPSGSRAETNCESADYQNISRFAATGCHHQHIDFLFSGGAQLTIPASGTPAVSPVPSPASIATADGHIQTFRTVGGQVVQNWYDPATGGRGAPIGLSPGPGVVGSAVVVQRPGTRVIDVFFRGGDNQLWTTWYDWGTGAIGGAVGVAGATITSDPTITATPDGHVQLFALNGGTIHQGWYEPATGRYGGWRALVSGPGAVGRIAATPRTGTQVVDLFFRGADNQLWTNWYNWGTGASGGGNAIPGATFGADPAVSATSDGHVQLFAVNATTVYQGWYEPATGQYGGWRALVSGPGAVGRIAATPRAGTQVIDVVFRGADNQMWTNWYNWGTGGSGGGNGIPGATFSSDPTVVATTDGNLQIFATIDGAIRQNWFSTAKATFGGWITLP